MGENKDDVIEALRPKVHLTKDQSRVLERRQSNEELNLLLFMIQSFYLVSSSGTYEGFITEPGGR